MRDNMYCNTLLKENTYCIYDNLINLEKVDLDHFTTSRSFMLSHSKQHIALILIAELQP